MQCLLWLSLNIVKSVESSEATAHATMQHKTTDVTIDPILTSEENAEKKPLLVPATSIMWMDGRGMQRHDVVSGWN